MDGYVEMSVGEMKQFVASTAEQLRKVEFDAEKAVEYATGISEVIREQFYFTLIKDIIEKNYDIGKVLEVYQIFGGYINMTFGVYAIKDGQKRTWLFRKYKQGKTIEPLMFEHKLLRHAKEHGFTFCAAPVSTIDGKTYHKEAIHLPEGEEEFYFAVFNYIDGERRYDWIPNWAEDDFQEATLLSAARNMAELHSSTATFDPEGLHGDNIMDSEDSLANELIAKYPETLKGYRAAYEAAGLDNPFIEYFDATYDYYRQMCEKSTIPAEAYEAMVICPCHCDFHAGNFKYYEDGTISGSFDYDMAKVDSRLFEIGLAMHYLFASWKLATDGIMKLDRVERFIKNYNKELENIGVLPPLNATEKKYLYEVMIQGAIYVYGWCASAVVYEPTLDPFEYLYYSQHFVRCLNWLEVHEEEIRELATRL